MTILPAGDYSPTRHVQFCFVRMKIHRPVGVREGLYRFMSFVAGLYRFMSFVAAASLPYVSIRIALCRLSQLQGCRSINYTRNAVPGGLDTFDTSRLLPAGASSVILLRIFAHWFSTSFWNRFFIDFMFHSGPNININWTKNILPIYIWSGLWFFIRFWRHFV